jgi:hypothetical protein
MIYLHWKMWVRIEYEYDASSNTGVPMEGGVERKAPCFWNLLMLRPPAF